MERSAGGLEFQSKIFFLAEPLRRQQTKARITPTTLRVHGLDCADEAAELRESLQSRAGVRELSFDLLCGLMVVEHDESAVTRDDLSPPWQKSVCERSR